MRKIELKTADYVGKLPFRSADTIPIRASGIPQYVQQPPASVAAEYPISAG